MAAKVAVFLIVCWGFGLMSLGRHIKKKHDVGLSQALPKGGGSPLFFMLKLEVPLLGTGKMLFSYTSEG
jgi:hypothetical protein